MKPLVHIVDDDEGVLQSLRWLLESVEIDCACHQRGEAFLDEIQDDRPGCVILDIRMPQFSGLEVFSSLLRKRVRTPVIFVTANGNISTAVSLMKKGAFDFIEKPYDPQEMLDRVFKAVRKSAAEFECREKQSSFRERLSSLSEREREVLREVVRGKGSKRIAADLGISCKTVDAHRASIRSKFSSSSVAELVRDVLSNMPEWCE